MATIIKDLWGNFVRNLNAIGGETLVDSRPSTQNITTLNGEVVVDCAGESYASINLSGTYVATLLAEYSVNGTDYINVPFFNRGTESFLGGISSNGTYHAEIPTGAKKFRVRCSTYTSGTAVVALTANKVPFIAYSRPIPSNLQATATGAAGAAVTLTIASAFQQFHYLTHLRIERFAAAVLTAAATPVIVTTSNLNGSRAYSFPAEAAAQGTLYEKVDRPTNPIKSSTASTNTTIICPATPNVIWRVSADYYVGL